MNLFPKKINKAFNKFNTIQKILTILAIIIILLAIYNFVIPSKNRKEGMITRRENFTLYKENNLYDDFYAYMSNTINKHEDLNDYEMTSLFNSKEVDINNESRILDIGSGTGEHINIISGRDIECYGIDKSSSMVERAQNNYPDCNFKQGDVVASGSSMLYEPNTFTHILALNFTVYYIKNKDLLLKNSYNWLMPGGTLIIHLVNRDTFDKISNIKDIGVSYSNYNNNEQYNSISKKPVKLIINDPEIISGINTDANHVSGSNMVINYKSDYKADYKNDASTYIETFTMPDGKIRQNEHDLYIPKQSTILASAKSVGFILLERLSLTNAGYKDQSLYVLKKPE